MKHTVSVGLAILVSLSALPSHASIIYDFSGTSTFGPFAGLTGSFTYAAPEFITSDTSVAVGNLDACASNLFGGCGEMRFIADSSSIITGPDSYDVVQFGFALGGFALFYFSNGAFSTAGSFDAALLQGVQEGHLQIRDTATSVPEPASIALLGIGLIAFAAARRRRKNLPTLA